MDATPNEYEFHTGERLEQLANIGIDVIERYLTDPEGGAALHQQARVAANALRAYTSFRQSEAARDALSFGMARHLAGDDSARLSDYVRVSNPTHPIVKLLPVPSADAVIDLPATRVSDPASARGTRREVPKAE